LDIFLDENYNQNFGAESCSETSTSINGKYMEVVNMRGRWNWLRIIYNGRHYYWQCWNFGFCSQS